MSVNKHDKIYKKIGQNIKDKRLELGLTQREVAQKIAKMDCSKISDMENGKEDFLFSTLLNVLDAIDLDIKDAFSYQSEKEL